MMDRRKFFHALAGAAAFTIPGLALVSSAQKFDFGNVYKEYQLYLYDRTPGAYIIANVDWAAAFDHCVPIWNPTPDERRLLQSYVDDYILGTRAA